jgi:hypothetical protein
MFVRRGSGQVRLRKQVPFKLFLLKFGFAGLLSDIAGKAGDEQRESAARRNTLDAYRQHLSAPCSVSLCRKSVSVRLGRLPQVHLAVGLCQFFRSVRLLERQPCRLEVLLGLVKAGGAERRAGNVDCDVP